MGTEQTWMTRMSQQNNVRLHQFKVKMFCAYHNPAGFYKAYHYIMLAVLSANCFVLNLLFDASDAQCYIAGLFDILVALDIVLLVTLAIEMVIRLWVIDCIVEYNDFAGKLKYLGEYLGSRSMDIFSIAVFAWSIAGYYIFGRLVSNYELNFLMLRSLHFVQVLQFYRVFAKIWKVFTGVLRDNLRILIVPITMFMVILAILSYAVYFVESEDRESDIKTFFDAFWFGFISLTTVGYGDTKVHTGLAKSLTSLLVVCGFCLYSFPAAYIGSALAMKLRERQKSFLIYQPAANLIQKAWKCYGIQMVPKYIYRFILAPGGVPRGKLTSKDRYIVILLHKLSFVLAHNRFKYANLVHVTGGAPLQYVRLQKKIELINEAVRKHKNDIHRIVEDTKKLVAASKQH